MFPLTLRAEMGSAFRVSLGVPTSLSDSLHFASALVCLIR